MPVTYYTEKEHIQGIEEFVKVYEKFRTLDKQLDELENSPLLYDEKERGRLFRRYDRACQRYNALKEANSGIFKDLWGKIFETKEFNLPVLFAKAGDIRKKVR